MSKLLESRTFFEVVNMYTRNMCNIVIGVLFVSFLSLTNAAGYCDFGDTINEILTSIDDVQIKCQSQFENVARYCEEDREINLVNYKSEKSGQDHISVILGDDLAYLDASDEALQFLTAQVVIDTASNSCISGDLDFLSMKWKSNLFHWTENKQDIFLTMMNTSDLMAIVTSPIASVTNEIVQLEIFTDNYHLKIDYAEKNPRNYLDMVMINTLVSTNNNKSIIAVGGEGIITQSGTEFHLLQFDTDNSVRCTHVEENPSRNSPPFILSSALPNLNELLTLAISTSDTWRSIFPIDPEIWVLQFTNNC